MLMQKCSLRELNSAHSQLCAPGEPGPSLALVPLPSAFPVGCQLCVYTMKSVGEKKG